MDGEDGGEESELADSQLTRGPQRPRALQPLQSRAIGKNY